MKYLGAMIILFFGFSINCFAQENKIERRSYTTNSTGSSDAPTIDGAINDAAWEQVEWTSDFVQFSPDNAKPPTEQTKMKIVYDDRFLYVAFKCYDKDPAGIIQRLSRRDGFEGDWVEVNIDSYDDDRTASSFTITAAGVKGDEFISNNGDFDESFSPIWYTKSRIDAEGWTAELKIPLTQLRFSNAEEQTWGLQATRRYFRNDERSTWQPLPPNPPGWVSEFGVLKGIKGIKPQKQLEIQPYALTKLDTYETEAGNPFRTGSDFKTTAGLDAKIGVTNDLTVDLTVNPDFGQVDADPGAIALDGFEIFFQERRPFFVENKNIFDYQISGNSDNLFFSRRIGRSPQGSGIGSTTAYIDHPQNTTILGAAKFSGKTEDGWSIGVLESVTAKEFATAVNVVTPAKETTPAITEEEETLVEPLTNYLVTRVQKDFNNNNSFVGGIFTGVHRNMDANVSFLHTQAYSGGLDFRHNWLDRKYYLEGNIVASQVQGSSASILRTQTAIVHLFQRVDASHVSVDPTKTSLTGTGGKLGFGKTGGSQWRYNAGITWRSPELDLNDIGFLRQADDVRQWANVSRQYNESTDWYRSANIRFSQSSNFDFEGNYNRAQYEINGEVNFKNNWFTEGGAAHKPRIFINSFLRGGPRWGYSPESFGYLFAGTDSRKKFSMIGGYVYSQAAQNNFQLKRYELRFRYQPINALSLSLETEVESAPSKTQYVTQQQFNGETRYITSAIDQDTWSATLKVDYTINPNLTIQYYGSPFISRGKYSNFNYVLDPVAKDLNDRIQLYGENQIVQQSETENYLVDDDRDGITDYSFNNPDFSYVQFRSNLVMRWEYIPGSELFFVWSQGVTGFENNANDGFSTIVDNSIFGQKPQNTFLIKATYRFVL